MASMAMYWYRKTGLLFIRNLLDMLISLSPAKINIRIDQKRFRPGEQPRLICNPKKFQALTGWKAEIPLENTLQRVLEWWRSK